MVRCRLRFRDKPLKSFEKARRCAVRSEETIDFFPVRQDTVRVGDKAFSKPFSFATKRLILACFVHAPIGVANILEETFCKGLISKTLSWILAALIITLGTTAVIGVYTGGAL